MRKTKIVATLGPATDDPDVMRSILACGLDVARFNFSHGNHTDHKQRIDDLRARCEETGSVVALLADTQGPEVRLGVFADGRVELVQGATFVLTSNKIVGDAAKVSITHSGLPGEVSPGTRILVDDGLIELIVDSVTATDIFTHVK